MLTIRYGPWTPDLANVGYQIPDQQGGAVDVPAADCLNVFYNNGTYQSLNTAAAVAGSPALASQCLAVATLQKEDGSPLVVAGLANGNAYYWTGSAWAVLLSVGQSTSGWYFAQLGSLFYVMWNNASLATTQGLNTFGQVTPGGSFTPPVGSASGNVLATVGQFLMVGDIYNQYTITTVTVTIGTGNGVLTTFNGTLSNVPALPGSIQVLDQTSLISGTDNGAGVISGTGISGTVNYDTGAVSVTFTSPPANGHLIVALSEPPFRARVQWSAIGNGGSWPTPLTNAALAAQSGQQDLEYLYGPVMAIFGYPLYGIVFQRNAITRATYIGAPVVFSWQTYSRNLGLLAKGAAVQVSGNIYFLSDQGFFYTDGAGVYPIGNPQDGSGGIDQWFFSNVNLNALTAIKGGYDGRSRCVFFAIPTGSNTLPDTLLTYNTISGRWTKATQASEMIWTDSDGFTDRLGLFDQTHKYSLLTGAASTGYLESADLFFTDGNTRVTTSVRPNIAVSSGTPTATLGTRNTLQASVSYSSATSADAFGGGFAGVISQGLYTRVRVSSAAATALHGATLVTRPGGPV